MAGLKKYCILDDEAKELLKMDKILKVSRTIADLAGSKTVSALEWKQLSIIHEFR